MARIKTDARIPTTNIRREQILDKCKGVCCHCGAELKFGDNFSIEHVIPLNKGGTNDFDNIVSLCKECNFDKSDDIVSVEYYGYAPKIVKEKIAKLLDEYYQNDWLTSNQLFKHDRFEIPVERSIYAKGNVFTKKDFVVLRRMKEDEFDAFLDNLEECKEQFEFEGENIIVVKEMADGQAYKVESKGNTLASVFLRLTPGTGKGGFGDRGRLQIAIAINPDIVWGPSAKNVMCDCINGIVSEFSKSMEMQNTKAVLMCNIDAFSKDKRAVGLIREMGRSMGIKETLVGDSKTGEVVFVRLQAIMTFGVELEEDENGFVSAEEFDKKEKLYSGQLRRRISRNTIDA